ncbi:hypothetical protein AB4048_26065 [Rhizobium sp. RAF56]
MIRVRGWQRRLPSHADTLSVNALRSLVTGLLERSQQAEARLDKLEADSIQLQEENAALHLENTRLRLENQLLRDEIARLKNLPPRPPFGPPAWRGRRMPDLMTKLRPRRSRAV